MCDQKARDSWTMAAPVWRKRGYISKAGSDSQLRKKLKIVSNGLKGIKQLEDDEDQSELAYLEGVCNEIVADEVLAHTNQEVRLLAMCCLVDVLRIYAPNAPFDDVQIQVRPCAQRSPNAPALPLALAAARFLHSFPRCPTPSHAHARTDARTRTLSHRLTSPHRALLSLL